MRYSLLERIHITTEAFLDDTRQVDSRVLGQIGLISGSKPRETSRREWSLSQTWARQALTGSLKTPQMASRKLTLHSVKRHRIVEFRARKALGGHLTQSPVLQKRSLQPQEMGCSTRTHSCAAGQGLVWDRAFPP